MKESRKTEGMHKRMHKRMHMPMPYMPMHSYTCACTRATCACLWVDIDTAEEDVKVDSVGDVAELVLELDLE